MDRKHLKIFIANVERILVEKGLTKRFLANKLGVKPSVISGILDGNGNPKLETMVAIADAIETPLYELLKDQSNKLIKPPLSFQERADEEAVRRHREGLKCLRESSVSLLSAAEKTHEKNGTEK